ncbi:hypothetical protein FK497_07265 [Wolbachia endosymbiont of Diaphorina citri]|uniref:hypothetical protein n=1 Tax=Wolbachia endosymbiont of Diaphorina citri TaxID=116598 RepID=UPI0015DC4325|nr:hypothetical protein [Wolbachia endosymbiont of Diaphorina citri]QLK11944.1 hypothetical protein FK497_07265 [Wolbachia endosymbiont of Diaphorina citri]
MQRNNDLNNGEVLKLAYYIKETMNFDNYANTRSEKRSDLEKLKSRLPESVKNIVFASQVCITNVRFNEYIYSVDSLSDQNRRIVRTWVPSSRSDPPGSCGNDEQGMWKIQPYGDYVCITNVRFNEYLYSVDSLSDQDRRIVYTWVPSSRVILRAHVVMIIKVCGRFNPMVITFALRMFVLMNTYTLLTACLIKIGESYIPGFHQVGVILLAHAVMIIKVCGGSRIVGLM